LYINSDKESRIIDWANFIVDTSATVRDVGREFNVAKSTVHLHVTTTLESLDTQLFKDVRKVLDTNKAERAMRGGKVTRKKYRFRKYGLIEPEKIYLVDFII
jgi:putative DeoR family transcriptional regulator (stage III sporulation protein D)